MYGDEGWVQAYLSPADGGTLLKVEQRSPRRREERGEACARGERVDPRANVTGVRYEPDGYLWKVATNA